MTEFIFNTLTSLGFHHPIHPALTHIPMGMVMGCFFFGLIDLLRQREDFRRTALHCSVLALVFILPTAFAGVLDWQHSYGGTLQPLIVIKIILAVLLTGLLILAVQWNRTGVATKRLFVVYLLCLLSAVGLGFSGGELVFGG